MPQVEFPADVHNAVVYLQRLNLDAAAVGFAIYKMRELGYGKAADWIVANQAVYEQGMQNGDYKVGSALKVAHPLTHGEPAQTKPIDLSDLNEPPAAPPLESSDAGGVNFPKKADSKSTKQDH